MGLSLRRKLRLELWPGEDMPHCFCGQVMDQFGDHCLSCVRHCKTKVSNRIRDGVWSLLKDLFVMVNLVSSPADVEKEPKRIIPSLPNTRPFDISALFDPLLDETAWRTVLVQLGFDVTVISSKPCHRTDTQAARKTEIKLRLRTGEKMKFQRKGRTDQDTGISMSGDEMIGDMLQRGKALAPISVSPHGSVGGIFERIWTGAEPYPAPSFADGRPNAEAAWKIATSSKVPRGVLKRANDIWHEHHPYEFYGGSYKAMDPWTYFDQKLGLVISSAFSSHLLLAHSKNKSKQPKECICEESPCPAQFPHPDDDVIFDESTGDNIGCCNNSCIGDDASELECAEHRHTST